MSTYDISCRIASLAKRNGTTDQLREVLSFVQCNIDRFPEDFQETSQKKYQTLSDVQRFSTGKLEEELVTYLAALCNWSTGKNNANTASSIMNDLGYKSYGKIKDRFCYRVWYLKKKKSISSRMNNERKNIQQGGDLKLVKKNYEKNDMAENMLECTPTITSHQDTTIDNSATQPYISVDSHDLSIYSCMINNPQDSIIDPLEFGEDNLAFHPLTRTDY